MGSTVELSDGRRGVVVRSNETHPGRPKVCIFGEEGAAEAGAPDDAELPPVIVDCLDPDPSGLSFAREVKTVLGGPRLPETAAWLRRKKDYLVSYSV
ncbi:MAG: hypothetical protein HYV15_00280 [Elusimicrobia bacterium]|nr:hypothetical protein [Elusimicrobiota bacterium]